MSDMQCPSEAELVAFADAELSPEQLNRIESHLKRCSPCAQSVTALKQLIEDIKAPGSRAPLDVAAHVAGVMRRLDAPVQQTRSRGWAIWSGCLAAAAAAALGIALARESDAPSGHLAARGGAAEASLKRSWGFQLYAQEQRSLRPLETGARIHAGAALTAGLRNLGDEPVRLLLFAVDARDVVHWIVPEFSTPGSNPEAVSVAPAASERLLPNAAVFDDLAPGPLRVVAVVTREPTHVSEVETLPGEELSVERLTKHFPGADIRELRLEVDSAP
jgi:hypothetical protein